MEDDNNKKRKSTSLKNPPELTNGLPNIVSPNHTGTVSVQNNRLQNGSGTTTTRTVSSFRMVESIEQVGDTKSLMYSRPEVFCKSLGGGIDLIWVDQGSNEAFINPLTVALFGNGTGTKHPDNEMVTKASKIFTCVPRRMSKEVNKAMMKDPKDSSKQYKKTYFIRLSGKTRNEMDNLRYSVEFIRGVSADCIKDVDFRRSEGHL